MPPRAVCPPTKLAHALFVSVKRGPISDVADAGITDWKRLRHAEYNGRARLERTSVGLVASAVLEKNAIAATYRRLAITPRVPCKTDARRGVEQMPLHAACRRAAQAALHQAPGRADNARIQLERLRD
jgi:hypothetical protein